MNALEVYELVKDIDYTIDGRIEYRSIAPWGDTSGFHYNGESILPEHALDLIIGAMKREMGPAWYGCQWSPFQQTWKAYIKERSDWPGYEAPTEPAAVIAAWRAWKEAKSEQ